MFTTIIKSVSEFNFKSIRALYNVGKLLSPGTTNYKTAKNEVRTFIMYLAAGYQNSKNINICPKASLGCLAACLEEAGRGIMRPVKNSRLNKSEYYVSDRLAFLAQLATELMNKIKFYRRKQDTTIYIRLNGTSDVDFLGQIKRHFGIDFLSFDNVVFYDYTAILGKAKKYLGTSYFHAFSRKEDNEETCFEALKLGIPCAMVFKNELPETYKGYKVVNGDIDDVQMIKYAGQGVILGLTAKGKAKNDTSGFVITEY